MVLKNSVGQYLLYLLVQVYAGSFCDIQPHLTNVRLNQWLNLTYSHTNCTTEILLYTPGYADRILNREDVTGITKLPTDDVIINNGNPLPSCASQVLGTTNISIDLRITKEVEEILNGVLAVKGSRSHHSCGCSCIPIPPVRYRVMPELSSTSAPPPDSAETDVATPGMVASNGSTQSISKYSLFTLLVALLLCFVLTKIVSLQ